MGAGEIGVKIVERPRVVRSETEVGLDVVERERVRRRERQDKPALVQRQAVELQPPVQRRRIVQFQPDFLRRNRRGVGFRPGRLAHADVFREQSVNDAESQPGKFQFDSLGAQRFHQPPLQEIRHADAVEPDERANQRDHGQHHRAAEPAEARAAFAPEAGSHITARLTEW